MQYSNVGLPSYYTLRHGLCMIYYTRVVPVRLNLA